MCACECVCICACVCVVHVRIHMNAHMSVCLHTLFMKICTSSNRGTFIKVRVCVYAKMNRQEYQQTGGFQQSRTPRDSQTVHHTQAHDLHHMDSKLSLQEKGVTIGTLAQDKTTTNLIHTDTPVRETSTGGYGFTPFPHGQS